MLSPFEQAKLGHAINRDLWRSWKTLFSMFIKLLEMGNVLELSVFIIIIAILENLLNVFIREESL